ncbi:DNA polymerase alpha/epsilon subunit B-domain-containing protein [Pterulicium gracile]|uniref:DNA-directed DNA polymerase n=1 Tax=Pterulicium gracile TaxID=1884261 RepID=A0A5C3QXX8_9AGAR|nr:DNA polymerase alpha/epsilon subunit B-domain-containing protein [Pterula gracilis]
MSRVTTHVLPPISNNASSFLIEAATRSYKHQYANIYYLRLQHLKDIVERRASNKWKKAAGNAVFVPRVLEVVKAQLSYIVGTVYMEMPLKPNVLRDLARDRSLPNPAPPPKMCSSEDSIMLEDESGRIVLVGDVIKSAQLVTGVILAALGMETPSGEFEVVDICFAGLAPQTRNQPLTQPTQSDAMEVDSEQTLDRRDDDPWLAFVSGLDVGAEGGQDAPIELLTGYLTGEMDASHAPVPPSQISRLIIVGNSLAPYEAAVQPKEVTPTELRKKKFGNEASTFSNVPGITLANHLLDIGQTLPIHLLPGPNDPAGSIMPQQPFPRAMFGKVASYATFSCETNPTFLHLSNAESRTSDDGSISCNLLINSGQPLNDMFTYLPSPPVTRLSTLESTLRWRHQAPTAPDTLWCHPYFTSDPFVIKETPNLYVVGGQPRFATKVVRESMEETEDGSERSCRIVMVPTFSRTQELVLVNMRTMETRTMRFNVEGVGNGVHSVQEAAL